MPTCPIVAVRSEQVVVWSGSNGVWFQLRLSREHVMAKQAIPSDVQRQAEEVVERFNREVLGRRGVRYVPRFSGSFLYLDRQEAGDTSPVCRLKYTGSFDKWEFAIFKYSSGRYDAQEWMFPGFEFVDGSIEGALKAGMAAYPE
jgi:hypothetical protein